MNQTEKLKTILSRTELNSFENYKISFNNLNLIKEYVEGVLLNIPPSPNKCASLSSLIGTIIKENSDIPVVVVSGGLNFLKEIIFDGKKEIPFSNKNKIINEEWFGHCWVECPNLIIDVSLVRTVNLSNISEEMKMALSGKEYIIDSLNNLESIGLDYIPRYGLNQKLQDGLIKSIEINKV